MKVANRIGTNRWARSAAAAGLVGGLALGQAGASIGMDAVHPAYSIAAVPLAAKYNTMGLAFLSDGRMVVLTTGVIGSGEIPDPNTESAVYIVSGVNGGTPSAVKVANMFKQPSGVNVVNDKIYVADRDAFYSINDNNNASSPSTNKTKITDWPMGSHWHHWVFTPIYSNGKFYAPYSGSIRPGGPSDVPPTDEYSGAFLSWDPDGKNFTKFCGGLRSPNGASMNDSGEMFVMDNQGSWLPGCAFMHMVPGKFYGHRQSPPNPPNWAESLPYQPPAVWIPYPSQIAGASTAQPIYVTAGPFAGQWFAGDANGPGLNRLALEKVSGEYQGAVFHFTNGTTSAAINRMAWGPDGALYLGSLEHFGNWPGSGVMPMYRMTLKAGNSAGASTFEMHHIASLKDGFEIAFTQPADPTTIKAANFTAKQNHYSRGPNYGCCKDADENLTVSAADISSDGKRAHLVIPGLKTVDYVVDIKLNGVKSAAGGALWDNEAWYTLNAISDRSWDALAALPERLPSRSSLEGRVAPSPAGDGNLDVTVDLAGAYSLVLRRLDGSLAAEAHGDGPGVHRLSAGPRAGVYVLEARQGGASFSRKVVIR